MWIPNLRSATELILGVAISMLAVPPTQAADYAMGESRTLRYFENSAPIRQIAYWEEQSQKNAAGAARSRKPFGGNDQAADSHQPLPDYILKSCTEKEQDMRPNSALRMVSPAGLVRTYISNLRKKNVNISKFTPALLSEPQHGTLEYRVGRDTSPGAGLEFDGEEIVERYYVYDPEPGFVGKDSATFMVEFEGRYYQVEIEIQVRRGFIDQNDDQGCSYGPKVIKVRKSNRGDAGGSVLDLSESVTFSDLSR
jgi:hypothetical protein